MNGWKKILSVAMDIINKYRNDQKAIVQNRLFPNISNQKLNSYLKEVADLCQISKNLTFHLARHTFATTVTLTNGVPIESVCKMLGYSKISTTQIYAKVIEKKLGEDMDTLQALHLYQTPHGSEWPIFVGYRQARFGNLFQYRLMPRSL